MKTSCALLTALLLAACQQSMQPIDFEKEKAAIQALIAKETESYYRQDFESWKSTYLDSPAFRKFGYWEGFQEKVTSNNGFESLKAEKKAQFEGNKTLWKGSTEERANENFRITRDMAWTLSTNSLTKKTPENFWANRSKPAFWKNTTASGKSPTWATTTTPIRF
jgi:hypothetical protein